MRCDVQGRVEGPTGCPRYAACASQKQQVALHFWVSDPSLAQAHPGRDCWILLTIPNTLPGSTF